MAASPAQIAANRANAKLSTGPRTDAGKIASRQNALRHGMTGGGVVVPGEDEHEVTLRIARLEPELAPEGSTLAKLLVRQVAIASIQIERAFRYEKAVAAERMRRAGSVFEDGRRAMAERILSEIHLDPPTARRRLLGAPEGIDLLIERLELLRTKAEPRLTIVWDVTEGAELDRCLGWRPETELKSRVGLLTRGITCDYWLNFDPAELGERTAQERAVWAVAQIHALITAEIAQIRAHRLTLDLAGFERGLAEAPERALLDLGKEGTALRRYAGAAERTMEKALQQLRLIRAEASLKAVPPPERTEVLATMATQVPDPSKLRSDLASFCPAPEPGPLVPPGGAVGSILADLRSSFVPIRVGRTPRRAKPTGP